MQIRTKWETSKGRENIELLIQLDKILILRLELWKMWVRYPFFSRISASLISRKSYKEESYALQICTHSEAFLMNISENFQAYTWKCQKWSKIVELMWSKNVCKIVKNKSGVVINGQNMAQKMAKIWLKNALKAHQKYIKNGQNKVQIRSKNGLEVDWNCQRIHRSKWAKKKSKMP